ncbi:polysaccharide deacetylase family protein [Streptomyces caniscabiei]|uniref:polysaccharide deacetylase family protein n=1 Tax=Streptomyces caniscabiei TaxID=2746961 RepID=UPI0029A324FE|nr:polysaccharide deacetylase family protein [Streptomyces caniscabiei]MDX2776527.1 polysaccharide deacetylase family protein [Streptomyces caniscabiei]
MKKVILYHAKKHPSLATMLLVASALVFVGICGYMLVRPIVRGAAQVQTVALSPHDMAVKNNSVAYPQFSDQKATDLIKQRVTKWADDFVASLGDTYDPRNRLVVDYMILHQGSKTASVQFLEQRQRTDKPTMIVRHLVTVDMTSQKELAFGDLFRPDADAPRQLGFLLYDYFKQDHPDMLSSAQFFSLLQFKPEMAQDFWVGDQMIGFSFNPLQPGSTDQRKKIVIQKSVIASILKQEYSASDPGNGVKLSADYAITSPPRPGDEIDINQKMIALTFDDGPGKYTERVLDALRQYRAHGTFFVLGQQVGGRAGVVKRMADEGHEIGNHSWDHALLPPLTHDQLQREINDTQQAVKDATGGYTPVLMRPPYGALSPGIVTFLHSQGLKEALWNADTEDWLHKGDSRTVYDAIMGAAGDGRVILLHDIHSASVEAVERAIPELVKQGYQLVTMTQLERYR